MGESIKYKILKKIVKIKWWWENQSEKMIDKNKISMDEPIRNIYFEIDWENKLSMVE